jgi:type II secretory pathway pseudopilin PulG
MQRFFSVIIIFGILLVGGGFLWLKKSDEEAKVKRADDLAAARKTFADKARAAAREEDEAGYMRGIRTALQSYDEDLKKRVYSKAPEARDAAAYKKKVDEQFQKGEIKEAQQKSMLEGYAIVKEAYDTIMTGNWKPVLTAKGKGDTRLDIFDVKRAKDDEGQPVLEGRFFFWGVEDATRMSWGHLSIRYWKVAKEEVKKGKEKSEEEVEKVLGKSEGESQPHIIIQNPNKYIAEFPSYVSVGYMWLPVMPHDAKSVDIEMNYVAKTLGGDFDSQLKFEKLRIPESWKLGEGETWEADTVEATEDEIAGKEAGAAEEAPAEKAPKKK